MQNLFVTYVHKYHVISLNFMSETKKILNEKDIAKFFWILIDGYEKFN